VPMSAFYWVFSISAKRGKITELIRIIKGVAVPLHSVKATDFRTKTYLNLK